MPPFNSRCSSLRNRCSPPRLVCAMSARTATPRSLAAMSASSMASRSKRKITISMLFRARFTALISGRSPASGCTRSFNAASQLARAADVKPARKRGARLAIVMRPELEGLTCVGSEKLRRRNVDRVERAYIYCKRALRARDDGLINRGEIDSRKKVRQFLALDRRLRIIESTKQPGTIHGSKGFDFHELGRHNPMSVIERHRQPGLREQ